MSCEFFEAPTREEARSLADAWIKAHPNAVIKNLQAMRIGSGSGKPGQELPLGKWTIVLEYDGSNST